MTALLLRFLIYGALGWCLEILFTGLYEVVVHRSHAARGHTYLWMHPIYGLTALGLELIHHGLADAPWLLRAAVYLSVIYAAEFSAGLLLKRILGRCPWDYGAARWSIRGLVRLDYVPAWLVVCALFEPSQVLANALAGRL